MILAFIKDLRVCTPILFQDHRHVRNVKLHLAVFLFFIRFNLKGECLLHSTNMITQYDFYRDLSENFTELFLKTRSAQQGRPFYSR